METVSIKIERIKNIDTAFLEFPLVKGTSVIVGGNGSGKSTILLALSQAFMNGSLRQLDADDYRFNSEVTISIGGEQRTWRPDGLLRWQASSANRLRLMGCTREAYSTAPGFTTFGLLTIYLNLAVLRRETLWMPMPT